MEVRATRMLGIGLLITAALGVSASAAQAAPQWYAEGKLVTGTVQVHSSGNLVLFTGENQRVLCTVADAGSITNPKASEAGAGKITHFSTSCKQGPLKEACGSRYSVEVLPRHLPWRLHLEVQAGLPGIRDVIEGVALEVVCVPRESPEEEFSLEYKGRLEPKVGNGLLEFELGEALEADEGLALLAVEEGSDSLVGHHVTTITAQ